MKRNVFFVKSLLKLTIRESGNKDKPCDGSAVVSSSFIDEMIEKKSCPDEDLTAISEISPLYHTDK